MDTTTNAKNDKPFIGWCYIMRCAAACLFSACTAGGTSPVELVKELSPMPPGSDLPGHCMPSFARHVDINTDIFGRDEMSISLFDGETVIATGGKSDPSVSTTRDWVGEVVGYPGSAVAVTDYQGTLAGSITLRGERYRIEHVQTGHYMLCKVDEASAPSGCAELEPDEETQAEQESEDDVSTPPDGDSVESEPVPYAGKTQIDLMVLYTKASRKRYDKSNLAAKSLKGKINTAVSMANQAYTKSNIPITVKLVHTAEVDYREFGSDYNKMAGHLKDRTDGYMDHIHALRDKHKADLVALIIEAPNGCGAGYTIKSAKMSHLAFSVVNSDCFDNHTLAHELGHNQGNAHNRDNAANSGWYPHSYGYRKCTNRNTGFRTIMAYPCPKGLRVDYANLFSNPKKSYLGSPTGIASGNKAADAARSMTATARIIAAFRGGGSTTAPSESSPAAPSRPSAATLSQRSIRVRWRDNSKNESKFEVYRKTGSGSWRRIATTRANKESYRDGGLRPGTRYSYRIRATNNKGRSGYTRTVSARTLTSR